MLMFVIEQYNIIYYYVVGVTGVRYIRLYNFSDKTTRLYYICTSQEPDLKYNAVTIK